MEILVAPKLKKFKKVGLAFGGGGARGFALIGCVRAFEEEGITFDYIAGTSIGSVMGAMLAYGLSSDQMQEIATNLKLKDIRKSKLPLVPSPTDAIEEIVKKVVGDIDIKDLKTPFCAVAVDMKSGNEVDITEGNLSKALAGSCAVPTVFHAVEFEDKLLFDGGLQNTIPADVLRKLGCDAVISVDINSTRGNGTDSTKYFDLIMASVDIMMKSNAIKGYLNSDLIIKPDLKRFRASKMDGMLEMIEEGYRATKSMMPQIKELLKRKKIKKHWWGFKAKRK
ncbi:MAG: patatin-like phospholipase family protein [Clostridia bacterium]|nr:patatin-like phospholipase family protein [Clostridia bacterium]